MSGRIDIEELRMMMLELPLEYKVRDRISPLKDAEVVMAALDHERNGRLIIMSGKNG